MLLINKTILTSYEYKDFIMLLFFQYSFTAINIIIFNKPISILLNSKLLNRNNKKMTELKLFDF